MNNPVDRLLQGAEVWWNNLWPLWEIPQLGTVVLLVLLAIVAALSPVLWRIGSSFFEIGDYFLGQVFGTNGYDTSQRTSRKKS